MKKSIELIKEEPLGIYLIAFLIPLYSKFLGLAILILGLEFLIKRNFASKQEIKTGLSWKNPGIWWFLFYLLHLIGLTYSENMKFGNMDIGMKASFAIFPVLFLFYIPKINWNYFKKTFIVGALISFPINMVLAYINRAGIADLKNAFQGVHLSHLMHRGYWAIYLAIAIFFCFQFFMKSTERKKKAWNLLGIFSLSVFLVLSQSKMGMIVLLLILVYGILKYSFTLKNKWILPAILFTGISILMITVPPIKNRFVKVIEVSAIPFHELDPTSVETSTVRRLVWYSSVELIQENFWFGVGTGDIKDELIKRNYENGFLGVAKQNLNCHNQYLNSHLALGFFASILLFMILLTNLLKRKGDNEYEARVVIVLILFLAMLTESMLEIQAGIIPYAFLLTLFWRSGKIEKSEN